MHTTSSQKTADKSLRIAVIGLVYVGLPLAVTAAEAGFHTLGINLSPKRVDQVNAAHNYIGDVRDEALEKVVRAGSLSASTDYAGVAGADFIAICVPTSLDSHQQPELSYIDSAAHSIGRHLVKDSVVVLESTVFPGTTEELLRPILEEESGLICGRDFCLGFSPERVNTGNTPKVVGGIGPEDTQTIAEVSRAMITGEVLEVSSPALTAGVLKACDLAVVTTPHGSVDYHLVQHAPLVFYTLNAMKDVAERDNTEVL